MTFICGVLVLFLSWILFSIHEEYALLCICSVMYLKYFLSFCRDIVLKLSLVFCFIFICSLMYLCSFLVGEMTLSFFKWKGMCPFMTAIASWTEIQLLAWMSSIQQQHNLPLSIIRFLILIYLSLILVADINGTFSQNKIINNVWFVGVSVCVCVRSSQWAAGKKNIWFYSPSWESVTWFSQPGLQVFTIFFFTRSGPTKKKKKTGHREDIFAQLKEKKSKEKCQGGIALTARRRKISQETEAAAKICFWFVLDQRGSPAQKSRLKNFTDRQLAESGFEKPGPFL